MFLYNESLRTEFGKKQIPATYIYNKRQNLVFYEIGAAKWDDHTVIDFLKSLK